MTSTDDLENRIKRLQEKNSKQVIGKKKADLNKPTTQVAKGIKQYHIKKSDTTGLTIRKPPKGDEQMDFFVPTLYDVGTKDSRSIMDVAVFRLSKKDKRIGEVIRYELPDGFVQVSSGAAGMASVWDYDIVLMAVSHLTEAVNRYREGKGDKPARTFSPHVGYLCPVPRKGKSKKQLMFTELSYRT